MVPPWLGFWKASVSLRGPVPGDTYIYDRVASPWSDSEEQNVEHAAGTAKPSRKGICPKVDFARTIGDRGAGFLSEQQRPQILAEECSCLLRDLKQSSLRGAVAVVPQDTVLFNDTLYRNIAYGRCTRRNASNLRGAQRVSRVSKHRAEGWTHMHLYPSIPLLGIGASNRLGWCGEHPPAP